MLATEPIGRPELHAAPLVGRAEERARLREALGDLLTRHGGLILIGGDIGIGKTALVRALAREANERGIFTTTGRGYDRTTPHPYSLWRDLFAHWGQPASEPELPPHLPAIGTPPPRPGPPRFDLDAPAVAATPDALGGQLRARLAEAAAGPMLIVLDDLHWADTASLELLRALARQLRQSQIAIVATYREQAIARDHPLHALLPSLAREAAPLRLRLAPLDDDAVRTLLWSRYGLPPDDEERLRAYLHARAEGNPLFIDELLRALEAHGDLRRIAPHEHEWILGELTYSEVPQLIAQIVDGQSALLDPEAGQLLTIAAILGRDVAIALWAEVAGVTEDRLLDVVDRAVAADLVAETAHGEGIRFRYALIRETFYGRQSASRRRAWHRRAGEALTGGGELSTAALDAACWHFSQAGDPRAITWLIRAGERAGQMGRWTATSDYFTRACALLQQTGTNDAAHGWLRYRLGRLQRYGDLGSGLESLALAAESAMVRDDRALLVMATFSRALLRALRGQLHWGGAEMARALAEWETLTADDLAMPRAQGFEPPSDPPWGSYALLLAMAGRFDEAHPLAARVAATARPVSQHDRLESFSWCDATLALAIVDGMRGDFPAAQEAYATARTSYRAAAHYHLAGMGAMGELYATLHYATDDLARRSLLVAEAEESFQHAHGAQGAQLERLARLPIMLLEGRWAETRELVALEELHGDVRALGVATIVGRLAREQGDAVAAWQIVSQQLPSGLATPPGDAPFGDTLAIIELASLLALDANDLPTMRSWLEIHDRWVAWGRPIIGLGAGQLAWAQYARAVGDLEGARLRAARARDIARAPRQPLVLLAAERLLGELALANGHLAGAIGHLEAARALADACAAPYERALTLVALAELHLARAAAADGASPTPPLAPLREAWLALDEARAICSSLGALPLLARRDLLAARLNALGSSGDVPPLVATSVPATVAPPEIPGVAADPAAAPMPGLTLTPAPLREIAPPAGLTQREVEVLRLIAAGLSNREIAARLFLSVRTAERHIANIYKKIDAHSKADATAFAFNCGLL